MRQRPRADRPAPQAASTRPARPQNGGGVVGPTGGSCSVSRTATLTTWTSSTTIRRSDNRVYEEPAASWCQLRQNCIDAEGLTITDAARRLGVARHTLSRVVHGHSAVSAEMAIRLEKAGWSNAEFWVRRQAAYDLAQARRREDRIVVGAADV